MRHLPAAIPIALLALGLRAVDAQVAIRGTSGEPIVTGAAVVQLDAKAVRASGARTLPELLAGRVPGLTVTYLTGVFGIAPQITIRSSASIATSPEPLLFVDGVLVSDPRPTLDSPLEDIEISGDAALGWEIDIDEIESVRVILGSAGGAMLDLGAPRGAVYVTTRLPGGEPRFSASAEIRAFATPGGLPSNHGTLSIEFPDQPQSCTLSAQSLGDCTATGFEAWNPLAASSPFQRGTAARASLGASGLAAGGSFRVAAQLERGRAGLDGLGDSRLGASASFHRALGPTIRTSSHLRLDRRESTFGRWNSVLVSALTGESADDSIGGYSQDIAGINYVEGRPDHVIDRASVGLLLEWSPSDQLRGTVRVQGETGHRRSEQEFWANDFIRTFKQRQTSLALSGAISRRHEVAGPITGVVTLGLSTHSDRQSEKEEARQISDPTLGGYTRIIERPGHSSVRVEERLTLAAPHRGFALGARVDHFKGPGGGHTGAPTPFGDLRWGFTEESFFPRNPVVTRGVLRGAFGTTGQQAWISPFTFTGWWNDGPESIAENEAGIDLTIANAVEIHVTSHRRRTYNATYFVPRPVSTGAATDQVNGMTIASRGTDVAVDLPEIGRGMLRGRTSFWWTVSRHRIRDLPGPPSYFLSPDGHQAGWYLFDRGYEVASLHVLPFTWSDANQDGIIDRTEVAALPVLTPAGTTQPTRTFGASAALTAGPRITIGAQLDGSGGNVKFNGTETYRCQIGICRALHDPTVSLEDQANAVAARYGVSRSGFLEDGGFVKLRELWLRVSLAGFVLPRERDASLTISGRNLATWTDYRGADPESGYSGGSAIPGGEFGAQRQLPSVTMHLRFAW